MAEGKKSFVLYSNLLKTVETLTDDEAGKLLKHLLRYVNDLNPIAPDRVTEVAFEPIKHQLKEDLVKWTEKSANLSNSGSIGGKKSGETRRLKAELKRLQAEKELNEANASKPPKIEADEAVNVICNSINTIIQKKDFQRDILEFFGFNEMPHNITHKRTINDFYNSVNGLDYFAQQFYDYSTYLRSANKMQYRMSLFNYLGDQKKAWEGGKWNNEVWSIKLKEFNFSKDPTTRGATDQSNNKDLFK